VAGTRIDSVEVLSMVDGEGHILELDADAIVAMVDGVNELTGHADNIVVLGDEGDVLRAYGDFEAIGSYWLDPNDGQGGRIFQAYDENGVRFYVDDTVLLEVHRTDGTEHIYGSRFADFIEGGPGADQLRAGAGDDQLVYDAADSVTDGWLGIDTLLVDDVDLTGVTSIANIERLDMTNGSPNTLQLDIADILTFVGDNGLDSLIPNGLFKLIIDGDATDTVILNGQNLKTGITDGSLSGGAASDFDAQDYFDSGEMYIKVTAPSIELYLHAGLLDPDPYS
jgi:hypothetical protein